MTPEQVEEHAVLAVVLDLPDQVALEEGRVDGDEFLLEAAVEHPVEEAGVGQLVVRVDDQLDEGLDFVVGVFAELARRLEERVEHVEHALVAVGAQVEVVLALGVLGGLRFAVVVQADVLRVALLHGSETELEDGLVAFG